MLQFLKSILPANLKNNLKAILIGNNWLESTYFSQFGEDVLIRSYFPKSKRDGVFVDVGAYQPVSLSNTYYFYLKGWRGINVEPNPVGIAAFNKYRPLDINLQVGVSEVPGTLSYHMIPDKPFENTFSQSQADIRHEPGLNEQVVELPVDTLANILDKHLPKGKSIDFFSIDVEGINLEVLRSNNWEKYRPKLIVVEKHLSEEEHKNQELLKLMAEKGYKLDYDILHSYFLVDAR